MQSSPFKKLLLILLLLAAGAACLWQFSHSKPKPQEKAPVKISPPVAEPHAAPLAAPVATNKPATAPESDAAAAPTKLPREKAEAWLAKHHRNAACLLAAFRALDDTNYLNEAATNFPNDPHVELTVLTHDEFPADRRQWLDWFKASSPSNSLADYLSAQDYFKNSRTNAAVNELESALGKPLFDQFTTESLLMDEELNRFSGRSTLAAGQFALESSLADIWLEDAAYKRLATDIQTLAKQKWNAGDFNAVAKLAHLGLHFADQIRNGDHSRLVINQLVGNAVEAMMLEQLDQDTTYDFLGGNNPVHAMQQLQTAKTALKELNQNFSAAFPLMSEEEMISYAERRKIYGELEAMKWAVQQHPPAAPAK
jgi:hypothetical protein